ncbi:MAG: oligosaccharide flippase family protein, partial [Actinomycetota bacterium]|nr:oligosaccharide flippase family protein [Actinomycetota bacterium]
MTASEPASTGPLSPAEIRRRAAAGAALFGARGVSIHILAFLGNVALARLLVPAEFGTVALGLAVLNFASLLSDAGLGAGLVRRAEPPTIEELRALFAVQLTATT